MIYLCLVKQNVKEGAVFKLLWAFGSFFLDFIEFGKGDSFLFCFLLGYEGVSVFMKEIHVVVSTAFFGCLIILHSLSL